MKIKRFWNWKIQNEETAERILTINGTIAEESWFDDDVTPQIFKDELMSGSGDITLWINSPGGDCIAAAQIYNMLTEYKGKVTVKIDGMAASAASVIAMAGDTVLVSPVSMMMVHNPATMAVGDHTDMQRAMDMLGEVKESIINAYEIKTGLSRTKLSHLMDSETWMNANKAVELGFADGMLERDTDAAAVTTDSVQFSRKAVNTALVNKINAKYHIPKKSENNGRTAKELLGRLDLIKNYLSGGFSK